MSILVPCVVMTWRVLSWVFSRVAHSSQPVIPAEAGIQGRRSGFRVAACGLARNDEAEKSLRIAHAMYLVRLFVAIAVWGIAGTGCSLTKPQPEVHHYALALQLPEARSNTAKTSLVIHPLSARDPYDQERIVYRTSPYAFDLYNFHRWASLPAEQVTHWTRRYLQATGLFSQVFPTTEGNADVVLGGMIRQFEEIDQEATWEAALSIEFWLIRSGERSPFWFRPYSATKPASRRNPEALAEAMSQGLADILQQLTTDLAPVVTTPSP